MKGRLVVPRLALAALCLSLAGACSRPSGPNIVLITLDTTRADRLGVMGWAKARTSNFDALAARGVLFERAYASIPLTLPSHTTMLTGLDPNEHGVQDNGIFIVPAELETVAERLQGEGYATGAFVSAIILDADFGLDQGFDVYDDRVNSRREPLQAEVPTRRGNEVTDSAVAWLDSIGNEAFFLWAHYYDVHAPREPPPPFDEMADPYDGELAYMDAEVGRLLEHLANRGDIENTIVIVAGDHGESLGDHEEMSHGIVAYDSTLHVPLIIAGPGFPTGRRTEAFARTVDITPTILAGVGLPTPERSRGRPLHQLVGNAGYEPNTDAALGYFAATSAHFSFGWSLVEGVRDARWKLTAHPEPAELFDTIEDPAETKNLAVEHPEIVATLRADFDRLASAPPVADPTARLPSPDVQEKLEALGYLMGSPASPSTGDAPDPRRFVSVFTLVDTARTMVRTGRVAEGIEALEILATSPISRMLALRTLAPIYTMVGRDDDAVETYRELYESVGTAGVGGLVDALAGVGRAEEALELLNETTGKSPPSRTQLLRGRLLLMLGRNEEAERSASELLDEYPQSDGARALLTAARASIHGPTGEIKELQKLLAESARADTLPLTRLLLADLLHATGRDVEAIALIERASTVTTNERILLAEIAASRGDTKRAIDLFEAVAAERPAAAALHRRLVELYTEAGRTADARAAYDYLIAINPKDAAGYVDRGAMSAREGKLEEAEADYRKAAEVDPELPEAYFNLALVQLQTDREEAAEKSLRRAVELRPDYRKGHFHLAMIYRRWSDPRSARHATLAAEPEGDEVDGS